jgi:hypothetical protein
LVLEGHGLIATMKENMFSWAPVYIKAIAEAIAKADHLDNLDDSFCKKFRTATLTSKGYTLFKKENGEQWLYKVSNLVTSLKPILEDRCMPCEDRIRTRSTDHTTVTTHYGQSAHLPITHLACTTHDIQPHA